MHACPPICASCRTNRAALSGCCCPRVPIPLSPWIEQGSQRALLLRPCSRACIRRAAGLIDASGMDITTMRARVEQARVGRLATARPDGRPHVVPCCRSERRGALLGRRRQNEIDRCIATARQHSRCSLGRDVGRPLRRRRAASGGSGSMGERESSTPDPSSTSHCSSSPASTSSNFEMRPRAPSSGSTSPVGRRGLDQVDSQLITCTADEGEGRALVTLRGSCCRMTWLRNRSALTVSSSRRNSMRSVRSVSRLGRRSLEPVRTRWRSTSCRSLYAVCEP